MSGGIALLSVYTVVAWAGVPLPLFLILSLETTDDGCPKFISLKSVLEMLNRFTRNDPYMGRTAPLTSKRCILYIYSTNIGTEYFKHAPYSPFFFSSKCSLFHNANFFGSCIIHILYTGVLKCKKKK